MPEHIILGVKRYKTGLIIDHTTGSNNVWGAEHCIHSGMKMIQTQKGCRWWSMTAFEVNTFFLWCEISSTPPKCQKRTERKSRSVIFSQTKLVRWLCKQPENDTGENHREYLDGWTLETRSQNVFHANVPPGAKANKPKTGFYVMTMNIWFGLGFCLPACGHAGRTDRQIFRSSLRWQGATIKGVVFL